MEAEQWQCKVSWLPVLFWVFRRLSPTSINDSCCQPNTPVFKALAQVVQLGCCWKQLFCTQRPGFCHLLCVVMSLEKAQPVTACRSYKLVKKTPLLAKGCELPLAPQVFNRSDGSSLTSCRLRDIRLLLHLDVGLVLYS